VKELIWVAEYHSGHFDFTALGESSEEAKKALTKGLKEHARRRSIPSTWFEPEDFTVYLVPLGGCVIDASFLLATTR